MPLKFIRQPLEAAREGQDVIGCTNGVAIHAPAKILSEVPEEVSDVFQELRRDHRTPIEWILVFSLPAHVLDLQVPEFISLAYRYRHGASTI